MFWFGLFICLFFYSSCLTLTGIGELNLAESEVEVVIHLVQSFVKAFNVGFGDP